MRRLWAIAVLCAVLLATAGCARPAGIDGDLADDWPAIGAPAGFTPVAGTCHTRYSPSTFTGDFLPVPCDQPHTDETVHVGTFTAAAAAAAQPPAEGSPALQAAYRECSAAADRFVGGDWLTGRLHVSVVVPSANNWAGGGRWFRCELVETRDTDTLMNVTRRGSLAGSMGAGSALRHGCFASVEHQGGTILRASACNVRHNAEFVGHWTAPDATYAALRRDSRRMHTGCRGVIAKYVGVPRDTVEYRFGTFAYRPDEIDWNRGERRVRCFLWTEDRAVTRSLKGTRSAGLAAG